MLKRVVELNNLYSEVKYAKDQLNNKCIFSDNKFVESLKVHKKYCHSKKSVEIHQFFKHKQLFVCTTEVVKLNK